jgi:putative flippase GtrA
MSRSGPDRREFIRFVAVGGLAAAMNIGARYAINLMTSFEVAVIVAYVIGMVTAFVLSKRFVFRESGRKAHDEFVRFGIINLVAAAQVWLISIGLARFAFPGLAFNWHPDTVAHVIGVAAPVVTSYLGHRHFTFAQRRI